MHDSSSDDVVISDVRTLNDVICETYVNSGVVMMISVALLKGQRCDLFGSSDLFMIAYASCPRNVCDVLFDVIRMKRRLWIWQMMRCKLYFGKPPHTIRNHLYLPQD
jgi:hypothetical protein